MNKITQLWFLLQPRIHLPPSPFLFFVDPPCHHRVASVGTRSHQQRCCHPITSPPPNCSVDVQVTTNTASQPIQAMDRAHRLGQRKVVNVHRLIMRGTLEEKVMSLQKFKVSVANAVINSENASLKTMNTDQLLDLFTPADAGRKVAAAPSKSSQDKFDGEAKSVEGGKGLKAILGGLEELWDQSQYADEYNLNQFLARLNG